ncbi:MAG: carbohydrate-binding domain-containing protein [Clostridia bacterium]|nr:carbohydrate-binding domain-containing protein [Clostridia bacterium]
MKNKVLKITIPLILALCVAALSGCSLFDKPQESASITDRASESGSASVSSEPTVTEAEKLPDPIDDTKTATGDFKITAKDGTETVPEGNVYSITAGGEYTASGKLGDGQIVVDAADDADIVLILSDASVSCSGGAPILVKNAGEVTVRAAEGTYNTVTDLRQGDPSAEEESEENYDAAIYSACDLKINGEGTLIVTAEYDNGVKSKDDVKIKDVTLKITAVGNAVKGNDSVTIQSGELILVSTEGDCVKTSNSDVSSKGNQRGTITISGGQVDIYSALDGLSASCNVEISGDETTVNVFTASYADTESVSGTSELYLIISKSTYSSVTDYYAYFYNDDDTAGVWKKFEYETMVYSGRTGYYGLMTKAPDGYANVIFNTVPAGTEPDGTNYTASDGGGTRNTQMNGFFISSISSGIITGDWVQISNGSGSDKTSYSSKGIKAENEIIVKSGSVTVYCMDDGFHANADGKLESGVSATGNITVDGGSVTIHSADDGMHADGKLTINGGTVNVAEAHEGLEGNVIEINGGSVFVYGSDDGMNACKGAVTPLINITGGYVDVTTPSGDTDAIDANGNFTMSGGTVLVKGGASTGGVAGSVDVDGSVTVTGGTIVALGGVCETPKTGSVCTYISSGTSFTAGDYTLKDQNGNEIFSFSLSSSYSSCWIASEAFELNGQYALVRGSTSVLSWMQSSSSVGTSGGWGGGFGHGGRR